MNKGIVNKADFPLSRLIKRWWKEFTCTHWNHQKRWDDGEGWYIVVCDNCHRARIHIGNEGHVE